MTFSLLIPVKDQNAWNNFAKIQWGTFMPYYPGTQQQICKPWMRYSVLCTVKWDFVMTWTVWIYIFSFERFLLVQYGHFLKINWGNTVYICQSQSQERKADVYARCDYKIITVFVQQTLWDSKDIPVESTVLIQGSCPCSSTLWHLFWNCLQSPFVWATWKENKPRHPFHYWPKNSITQHDYSPNSLELASNGFQFLLNIRTSLKDENEHIWMTNLRMQGLGETLKELRYRWGG